MKMKTHAATITAIHTCVGPIVKRIDDEVDLFGGNTAQIERIKKTIGLDQRRVVDENTTALDLCESAAKHLPDLDSSDALIFVTQTPDHFQPGNACILHGRLGFGSDCAAFDINLGCSGWVYGLSVAFNLVESGSCRKVLLLAGDTLSRCVNPRDRSVASLFGDAGSATLIESTGEPNATWFSLHTNGDKSSVIQIPAGGFRRPIGPKSEIESEDEDGNIRSERDLVMDGAEVFNFSIKEEPLAIREILEQSSMSISDIEVFFLHQANRYILNNIAKRLKLELNRVPSNIVEQYGNQSCASIPMVICDFFSENDVVRDHPYIVSGFGVGLSWATALIYFDHLEYFKFSSFE